MSRRRKRGASPAGRRLLRIAQCVSRVHGEVFADIFFQKVAGTEVVEQAFAKTRLMEWPGETDRATMLRYTAIEREILAMTFQLAKGHIAEIFAAVASVVLARERISEP